MLKSDDVEGKEFRFNICQYNMALSFTSLGVRDDASVNRRGGWVFCIQGELCHLIGSLRPYHSDTPSYTQLYIYDAQLALALRMNRNDNLRSSTMSSLQSMLLKHHRYSKEFKHMYEILQDYPNVSDANIRLHVMPGQDSRQYNLPFLDEVAVILSGDGTASKRRDIVLRPCCQVDEYPLARIDDGHLAYSPLHYVVLFLHGDHGWHHDLYYRPSLGSNHSPKGSLPHVSQT
jgi:hypothetical protein